VVPYFGKISAAGKLVAFGALTTAVIFAPRAAALAPATIVIAATAFLVPRGWRRVLRALGGSATLILFAAGFGYLNNRAGDAGGNFGAWTPTALLAARLAALAALGGLFAAVAAPEETARALFAPFRRLTFLRRPAADAALMSAFALRFFSDTGKRLRSARDNARLRVGGGFGPARFTAAALILRAGYREAMNLAIATAQTLYLRGIQTPAVWLEITGTRKPFGWAAVITAAAAGAATVALAYLWPNG